MKILLVEDDAETASYVAAGLREYGHVVDHAATGPGGLQLATGWQPHDVLIIDRMLPGLDGLAIVKAVRNAGLRTPILLLTTMDGIDDRVEGLESGADDYLIKPFAFAELLARTNALARRPANTVETILRVADLEMDLVKRTVTRGARKIVLQPREFQLLEYFMRNAGRVVTRTMLLEHVWDFHFDPRTNIVETHVSRLRGKVDRDFNVGLIHTIRGSGYSLRAPE
jgi:two-component system, OmpR family, response regulator